MIDKILYYIGVLSAIITPIINACSSVYMRVYSGYIGRRFNRFGRNSKIKPVLRLLVGGKYIEVGKNCLIGNNVQLTAYDHFEKDVFHPSIKIGNNSVIGDLSHITAINSITIGNNVLMGRNILISDNSHGQFSSEQLVLPPLKRYLFSKGPVIIEDDVWIGEKASIMANVRVGRGSVIAANSVVTTDVPPYSLVAGCPATIKKSLTI